MALAETADERGARIARSLDTIGAIALTIAVLAFATFLLIKDVGFDPSYYTTFSARLGCEVWLCFVDAAQLALFATTVAYLTGLVIGFLVGSARTLKPPRPEEIRPTWRGRIVAGARRASRRASRRFSDFYVETVRGTPLVVQIFFVWSLFLYLPLEGWTLAQRSLVAGILAMAFNTGGYQGEIFRGGFQTVSDEQRDAARAIGMTRLQVMGFIVLPQALRLVIPPLTNEYIALFKASSLLFFIGLREPTFVGDTLAAFNPRVFEIFVFLTAIYLAVTVPLSRAVGFLESTLRIPGLGVEAAPRTAVRRPIRT